MSTNKSEVETSANKANSENEVLVLKNQRLVCLLNINDIETDISKMEKEDQTSMLNQNKLLTAKNERFELLLKAKQMEIEIKNFALKTATKAAATAIREQEKVSETSTTTSNTKSRKASPTHTPNTKPKPSSRNKPSQQPLSAMFFSFETKLTSGFTKFVENKPVPSIGDYDIENINNSSDPLFDLYDTYQDWYEDICNLTKPLNSNMVIDFPGHLFVKWKLSPKKGIIFSSQETEGDSQSHIETGTLAAGWTHENTRMVTVLHPNNNNKIIELFPMGKSKEWHIWKNIERVAEYQNCDGYVLICCRRRTTTRTVSVSEATEKSA